MVTERKDTVKARPTKAFFVEMLTKDVNINSAIMDLVDNSIDGALRIHKDQSLDGLFVYLTISGDKFEIRDNCGGISVELAKEYAFRFGRDPNAPLGSIGLFGVGMKRAIFKLGQKFEVSSVAESDSFSVNAKIADWLKDETEPWTFPMDVKEFDEAIPEDQRGTVITVDDLYEGVAGQFASTTFVTTLLTEIETKHQVFIERRLNIQINGRSAVASAPKFAFTHDGALKPAYENFSIDGVAVRLYSGIGDTDVHNAGWYVYCNGRMVVTADQTKLTGWGELGTTTIPRYHHQFARFRGCAFFDSQNSTLLPWNTTKDGVDVELPIYRTVKLKMVSMMRPVITFLNQLDKELEEPDEEKRVLTQLVQRAAYLPPTSDIPVAPSFHYVKPLPRPRRPRTIRIQYERPETQVQQMKKCLHVYSAKRVGEMTFDWYLKNECQDE